jgi:hypothetical protein
MGVRFRKKTKKQNKTKKEERSSSQPPGRVKGETIVLTPFVMFLGKTPKKKTCLLFVFFLWLISWLTSLSFVALILLRV